MKEAYVLVISIGLFIVFITFGMLMSYYTEMQHDVAAKAVAIACYQNHGTDCAYLFEPKR